MTRSVELVAALREHLMIEASMPLDETLRVNRSGSVKDHASGGSYSFRYSGLAIDVEPRPPRARTAAVVGPLERHEGHWLVTLVPRGQRANQDVGQRQLGVVCD